MTHKYGRALAAEGRSISAEYCFSRHVSRSQPRPSPFAARQKVEEKVAALERSWQNERSLRLQVRRGMVP